MRDFDSSGLGRIALAAAIAAVITGLVDKSLAWLVAAVLLLAIWGVHYIFAISPSVYAKTITWLEMKYEQTLPCRHKNLAISVSSFAGTPSCEDTLFDTQLSVSPAHSGLPLNWTFSPSAAADTSTDEICAMKENIRQLVAAF